ncbi:hypothetical protein PENFLA_c067G05645 [Penicillium flavigenum]|uniref:Uncharacterized protein n=1 Tax=Penicillium flavigenum TaxID=254877 RepID=A0A1V6SDE0_9EURO|nr:hypothetical protein PENFLA_c067G05645 [Penicillium flavigenum]
MLGRMRVKQSLSHIGGL